jgi:hypothetical protein
MNGYQGNNHKCRMKQPWDTQICQEVGQENLNRNLNSASRAAQEAPKGGLKGLDTQEAALPRHGR